MTSHVGADTHFSLGRRCEMEVGIETGYRVDMAKRHMNPCGELLQSINRQKAELVLNGPKFVDQAPRSPCFRMVTSLSGILTSKVRLGEWRTWGRKRQPSRYPSVSGRTIQSIDFAPKSGYKQDDYPKMQTVNYGRTALRMAGCLTFAILIISTSAAQNSVVGKYNGPGGCASSSCHGSIQPKQITRVPQNAYSTWARQDKPARPSPVLPTPLSLPIPTI